MSNNGRRKAVYERLHKLSLRGLTVRQIGEATGYSWTYVNAVLRDPDGTRQAAQKRKEYWKNKARNAFEREHIRTEEDLPAIAYPGVPDRMADVDVSGDDGVRFVVIPVTLGERSEHEKNGRAGWTVFDTAYKKRVGIMRERHHTCWQDCRHYNAREETA